MSELIGQTLGPYRIIEQIGIGGMATVYKAYQPSMDRYVAIKVLPALVSRDPAFLKRFRREAKVVAKLEHKHILPVHDYGEQEGLTYLVMRYVEAGTLKDRLAAGQLDLPAIYRIIAQVGAALDYAHRLGVIHRDVKPTNVLIDSQGDAYLTDFGLARIMESSEQLTATGVGVGTPAYMAPEQGQGLKIDHRSDIYSLGVMLYEMATGRVPYEAETPMAVVIKHITDPLPLPSSVKPDIPPQVERVILKAMAKDPDDRFQTVAEMVTALDAAVRLAQAEAPMEAAVGELAVAKEAAPPAKGFLARAMAGVGQATQTGWGKTAMWAAVGIVALLAFFLALSRVPLKVQIRGGQLEVVRVVEVPITPEAAVPATTPTEAVAAGATATPTPLVTEGAPPVAAALTPTLMGRIVYWNGSIGNDEIYVANSDGSDEQRLTDRLAGDWEPAWSPDGTRIVFDSDHHAIGEDRNQLYVVDADGSNLTRLTYTEGNEEHPSWSPDGSRIAFHSNGALVVIKPDGSNWTTLVEVRDDLCVQHPTWSPDSQRIAFRSKTPCGDPGPFQHDIYVVNDDGSGLLKLASFTSETAGWYVVWSPDGGQVAFDVELDGERRFYTVNSDGSGEPAEIPSIPDSWYPWYWPQWAGEAVAVPTPVPDSMANQARVFAEPILAAIAERPPDYEDDFSDPTSGWGVGGQALSPDVEGETGYMDGEYFMIAAPGACIGAGPPIRRPPSDFVLEVEGRFISGQTGDWALHFRTWRHDLTNEDGKYAVVVHSDGHIDVFRFESENESLLGSVSSGVKSGTETNSLRLIAVGPEIALYANGEPVFYVSDSGFSDRFRSGDMNFVPCNKKGTIPLRVQFDNLRIWDISELALASTEATPAPQPTATPIPTPRPAPTPIVTSVPVPSEPGEILSQCGDDLCIVDRRGGSTSLGLAGRYVGLHIFSWSPDGQRIAFSGCDINQIRDPKCRRLYMVNRNGDNVVRVRPDSLRHEFSPAWSPNGEWIAYHDSGFLSVVRPDGTGRREVAPDPYCPANIAWSSDSRRIAWLANWCDLEDSPALLLVVNLDGSDMRLLWQYNASPSDSDIAWTPDGRSVAVRFPDGTAYLIDPDCEAGPDGCDESSRTGIDTFPEHWLHTFYPQWAGETVVRVVSAEATPAPQPTPTPTAVPAEAAPPETPTSPSAGTGSATGRILWNDEPFAGVVVKLCTEWSMIGGCKGAEYTAVSGADGRYTIADLPPGSYRIATQIHGQENETGWMGMRAEVRSGEVAQVKDLYVVKYDLQLLSPHEEETVKTATPALTWAGYPHAGYYKVYLAPQGGGEAVIQFEKTAETTYTVASPLQPGKYHWSIHAYNAGGTELAEGSGRFTLAGD